MSGELEEAIQLCQPSLGDIRCLSYELAPPGFQVGHLVESLKRLATTFARRTGMLVMLCAAPVAVADDDLSLESSEAIYRSAEESLYNVRRHSGASKVTMQVERAGGELQLRVIDDGRGMASGSRARQGADRRPGTARGVWRADGIADRACRNGVPGSGPRGEREGC